MKKSAIPALEPLIHYKVIWFVGAMSHPTTAAADAGVRAAELIR